MPGLVDVLSALVLAALVRVVLGDLGALGVLGDSALSPMPPEGLDPPNPPPPPPPEPARTERLTHSLLEGLDTLHPLGDLVLAFDGGLAGGVLDLVLDDHERGLVQHVFYALSF